MAKSRRRFLSDAAKCAIAGLIGNLATRAWDAGMKEGGERAQEAMRKAIEEYLGSTIEIPILAQGTLKGVEFDFRHGPKGYLLKGRRVVWTLKGEDGAKCVEMSQSLIEMGLFFKIQEDLRIEVDLTEVKGLQDEEDEDEAA